MAAYSGNFECLKYIVDKGGKLLAQNRNGETLLHISIKQGHTEFSYQVVALIQSLRFKANALNLENVQDCLTPYMLAVLREQFDVANLLLSAGLASRDY